MTEDTRPPFFINTKRLQRAESYFDIGRAPERLRRFLEQKRNPSNGVITPSSIQVEDYGLVGYYGIDRYIKLDEDEELDEDDLDGMDEDVQYQNTSMFSLFWMTFKNVAGSIGEHFSKTRPPPRNNDPEGHPEETNHNTDDFCRVLVHPPPKDPRIKEDMIVYGDMKYLVQKFRISLKRGSVDVAMFSVQLPELNSISAADVTDLQAFVVSPDCGSLVWIENGRASAIFVTKSAEDFFGNVMEWFRKVLSDMTLADSVMIGHPYYWQPNIRRRLTRVMRYLKRLYRKLALKDKGHRRQRSLPTTDGENAIEVVCPADISKIVINEHQSKYLMRSTSTRDTLNVMLEHLVAKWFRYQYTESQIAGRNVEEIAKIYSASHPPRPPTETDPGTEFLESVTFLDFFPEEREGATDIQQQSTTSTHQVPIPTDSNIRRRSPLPAGDNSSESNNGSPDENENLFIGESYRYSSLENPPDKYTVREFGI